MSRNVVWDYHYKLLSSTVLEQIQAPTPVPSRLKARQPGRIVFLYQFLTRKYPAKLPLNPKTWITKLDLLIGWDFGRQSSRYTKLTASAQPCRALRVAILPPCMTLLLLSALFLIDGSRNIHCLPRKKIRKKKTRFIRKQQIHELLDTDSVKKTIGPAPPSPFDIDKIHSALLFPF